MAKASTSALFLTTSLLLRSAILCTSILQLSVVIQLLRDQPGIKFFTLQLYPVFVLLLIATYYAILVPYTVVGIFCATCCGKSEARLHAPTIPVISGVVAVYALFAAIFYNNIMDTVEIGMLSARLMSIKTAMVCILPPIMLIDFLFFSAAPAYPVPELAIAIFLGGLYYAYLIVLSFLTPGITIHGNVIENIVHSAFYLSNPAPLFSYSTTTYSAIIVLNVLVCSAGAFILAVTLALVSACIKAVRDWIGESGSSHTSVVVSTESIV